MRTTLTIQDHLMRKLREMAFQKKVSLKTVVNQALDIGMRGMKTPFSSRRKYRCKTFSLGRPRESLDRALEIASRLEDEEIARKLALRK